MKCKKVKLLIVSGDFNNLSFKDKQLVNDHIRQCPSCLKIREDLELIQRSVKTWKDPVLPGNIERTTRKRCMDELGSHQPVSKNIIVPALNIKIPRMILVALFVQTLITAVLISTFSGEHLFSGSLSSRTIFTLVLIFQNTLMLFLSPLLILKYGKSKKKFPALLYKSREEIIKNKYPPGLVRIDKYQGGEKWLLQKGKLLGSFSW